MRRIAGACELATPHFGARHAPLPPAARSDQSTFAIFDAQYPVVRRAGAKRSRMLALFFLHFCVIVCARTTRNHPYHTPTLLDAHFYQPICILRLLQLSLCVLHRVARRYGSR